MCVIYVGIDPGAGGGLACLGQSGSGHAVAVKMPDTDGAVLNWMRGHKAGLGGTTIVAMERVGGYVNRTEGGLDGRKRSPGSAMFNFGTSYGALRMAVVAVTGRPPILVEPSVWQRGLMLSSRGKTEGRSAFKARLKKAAQALFPDLKVTLGTADALLICEFIRREKEGTLKVYAKEEKRAAGAS